MFEVMTDKTLVERYTESYFDAELLRFDPLSDGIV